MKILGLDPGLRRTGWGIIETGDKWIDHGVIVPDETAELAQRLAFLYEAAKDIINRYQPDVISLEEIFVNINPQSTLKLGMARGVLLLLAGTCHITCFEYGANKVKKTVVGVGHAEKHQVSHVVELILKPAKKLCKDSSDALALALTHASHKPVFTLS